MDKGDALLLLVGLTIGAVFGGVVVYTIFSVKPATQQVHPSAFSYIPVVRNEEVWEWEDYKGRKRTITVHREVKELE